MPDTANESDFIASGKQVGIVLRVGDPADVAGGRRAINFADAIAVIRGGLGDDGEGAWTPDAFGRRRDVEVACLAQWADERGLWLPNNSLGGRVRGRMEHDILPVGEPVRRIVKITKGGKLGFWPYTDPALVSGMVSDWFVLKPAPPLQYLLRMADRRVVPRDGASAGRVCRAGR